MVNFVNILTSPYKIVGAAPKALLNCCTGKIDMSNLNPCSRDDSSSGSSNGGVFSNPLGGIFNGGNEGKKTKYLDHTWDQLPGDAQNAANTLGYNQSNWEEGWASCQDKWWEDLNTSEKEAATTLGWDKDGWDSKYNEKRFEELPSHVQEAAQTLGFTSQVWNNDEWPSSTDQWWDDFSDEQKKALNTLGYGYSNWE